MDGHDRNPVTEKITTNHSAENNSAAPALEAEKIKRKAAKTAKPSKRADKAKKQAKHKADRSNKKAEVIAMLKRSRGATLKEIMAAMNWQAHTVRGFVSILGSKGGEKVESSRSEAGERTYRIAK
jgi:hypothetical protein